MPDSAEKILNEILIATVLKKDWDYKRIARFAIDKQLEILEELYKKFDHPDINNKISELRTALAEIKKIKEG